MRKNSEEAVEKVIRFIWERYSEPLSLTEIAGSAALSRFHFTRMFTHATGITPGRFLAAVRIYQAKRMLLNTSMTIADISSAVGYKSLGSFTSHFTESVGISPGRFRRGSRNGGFGLLHPPRSPRAAYGAVAGTISLPEWHGTARVYVGAFETAIVKHPLAAAVIVDVPNGRPCCYHLPDVPEGTWYVHAVGVADSAVPKPRTHRTQLVGGHDPITVTAAAVTSAAVRLRPSRPTDPPILLALPDLEPPFQPSHHTAATPCAAAASRPAPA